MSAWETAVTTTCVVWPLLFPLISTGTEFVALNSPVVEIVPVCGPPPVMLFTCHVTNWFAFPVTAAMNCIDPNVGTLPDPGVIDTFVAGAARRGPGGGPALPLVLSRRPPAVPPPGPAARGGGAHAPP